MKDDPDYFDALIWSRSLVRPGSDGDLNPLYGVPVGEILGHMKRVRELTREMSMVAKPEALPEASDSCHCRHPRHFHNQGVCIACDCDGFGSMRLARKCDCCGHLVHPQFTTCRACELGCKPDASHPDQVDPECGRTK